MRAHLIGTLLLALVASACTPDPCDEGWELGEDDLCHPTSVDTDTIAGFCPENPIADENQYAELAHDKRCEEQASCNAALLEAQGCNAAAPGTPIGCTYQATASVDCLCAVWTCNDAVGLVELAADCAAVYDCI